MRPKLPEPWPFLSVVWCFWPWHFYKPCFLYRKQWRTKSYTSFIILKNFWIFFFPLADYLLSAQYESDTLRIQERKYRQGFLLPRSYGWVGETYMKQGNKYIHIIYYCRQCYQKRKGRNQDQRAWLRGGVSQTKWFIVMKLYFFICVTFQFHFQ